MVHAEHSSEMILKDPATGKDTSYSAGEPVGFIIELENGFKIYHMGDTGLFGDMKLIGEYYKPDLLLVPIGGHYVMNPKDAAYATKELIKPKMAWPMHYASNPFLKGTPAEFKAALGQTLDPGDRREAGRQEDVLGDSSPRTDFPHRLRQDRSDRSSASSALSIAPARGEQAIDGGAVEEALGLAVDEIIVRRRSRGWPLAPK